MPDPSRRIRPLRRPAPRRGSVVLELIVMLPIWLIVMGAIVQFGLVIGNRQQVALASRVGAEEASQTTNLSMFTEVPGNVVEAVEQQLLSSGINHCKIILQHNVGGASTLTTDTCECDPFTTAFPEGGKYVRVTVCVPVTELAPNVLTFFGFDISDRLIRNATTFRYELQ